MIKNILLAIVICSVFITCSSDNRPEPDERNISVLRKGDELFIGVKQGKDRDLLIQFRHCMFNNIMTFHKVGYARNIGEKPLSNPDREIEELISEAFSDNIGPLAIEGTGWVGGNHSYREQGKVRTAKTESFTFKADGKDIEIGKLIYAKEVAISVVNSIFYAPSTPAQNTTSLVEQLCIEKVDYNIEEANVLVSLTHEFLNAEPVTVSVYYGAQSMGQGNYVYFPNGSTPDFVVKGDIDNVLKKGYPLFNRFVQKKTIIGAYEAVYLRPEIGLGNHSLINENTRIYLSLHGKLYHNLIDGKVYKAGDTHTWSALYSWFQPSVDNDDLLVYETIMNGRKVVFADVKRQFTGILPLPKALLGEKYRLIEKGENITIAEEPTGLKVDGKGSLIIEF